MPVQVVLVVSPAKRLLLFLAVCRTLLNTVLLMWVTEQTPLVGDKVGQE
jgi:hypothetical protein